MIRTFTILSTLVLMLFFTGAVSAQDTLYTETVLNGTLENIWYPEWGGNNMETEFMAGNPSGDSWVGKLGNDISGGGVGTAFSGDPTWTDFRLEAQVYVSVDQSTAATYYGIEFRMDSVGSGGSGYQFLTRFKQGSSDQGLRFRARSGATPTTIKQWLAADIPGGIPTTDGWHHLAVEVEGNQFRFFFDGTELPGGPYIDDTFGSGWIGAYVWDFAVSPAYLFIDDIYVIDNIPLAQLTVDSPNGGEVWVVNETKDITWSSENVNDVKIELSIDNGVNWSAIVDSIPSAGTYSWVVSAAATSTECLIRISDVVDSTVYDESDSVFTIDDGVSVENIEDIPTKYELIQNFPNPFNPSTTISFVLPVTELVKFNIYNNLGQKVRSLTNREFTAGTHQVYWDGLDEFGKEAPAGVYFYQIQAGSFQAANKMLLIK